MARKKKAAAKTSKRDLRAGGGEALEKDEIDPVPVGDSHNAPAATENVQLSTPKAANRKRKSKSQEEGAAGNKSAETDKTTKPVATKKVRKVASAQKLKNEDSKSVPSTSFQSEPAQEKAKVDGLKAEFNRFLAEAKCIVEKRTNELVKCQKKFAARESMDDAMFKAEDLAEESLNEAKRFQKFLSTEQAKMRRRQDYLRPEKTFLDGINQKLGETKLCLCCGMTSSVGMMTCAVCNTAKYCSNRCMMSDASDHADGCRRMVACMSNFSVLNSKSALLAAISILCEEGEARNNEEALRRMSMLVFARGTPCEHGYHAIHFLVAIGHTYTASYLINWIVLGENRPEAARDTLHCVVTLSKAKFLKHRPDAVVAALAVLFAENLQTYVRWSAFMETVPPLPERAASAIYAYLRKAELVNLRNNAAAKLMENVVEKSTASTVNGLERALDKYAFYLWKAGVYDKVRAIVGQSEALRKEMTLAKKSIKSSSSE